MNTGIKVHIPDELLAQLDAVADKENKCRSLLIRKAIALLIDFYNETNEVFNSSREQSGIKPSMSFAKYINFKMGIQDGAETQEKGTHDECNCTDGPT